MKYIQDLIKGYESVEKRAQDNKDQREYARERLGLLDGEIKKNKEDAERYDKEIEDINKENEFVDKLTAFAKNGGNKGGRMTKLIGKNAEYMALDAYDSVRDAYAKGDYETVLAELLKIKENNDARISDIKRKSNTAKFDQGISESKRDTFKTQLDLADEQSKDALKYLDAFREQVRSTAEDILKSTFEGLGVLVSGESKKKVDFSKNKAEFMKAVGNAKTDAQDLFEKGIISEAERDARVKEADALLTEESLRKFEYNRVLELSKKLGLEYVSPDQKALFKIGRIKSVRDER